MLEEPFFPYQSLASDLLAFLPEDSTDGSHDLSHIHRVWMNVRRLQDKEGCLLYTSPSPRDRQKSRMPSSA